MINGSIEMKDAIGPTATATGTGVAVATPLLSSPSFWLQVVGIVIALVGVFYTRQRSREATRSNDINEERLAFDKKVYEDGMERVRQIEEANSE